MWTSVLLLLPIAAVLSAPVNLPQTITCPDNNIFVYVNGSAHDRTPYIFVELNATDLHDCIHKCFGNQFCYSLKYESTAVEPCSLYYFAAYNCSGQKLVQAKEVQYPGGAITIDCLRCPANGDFVTAPPFDSFTEQTIVAKDAAGNPILSKPLDKVVTDNIELKLAPGHLVPVSTTEEPKEATTSEAGKENESTTLASTTTAIITTESRKMIEERKCSGSLKYRIQTDIDRETVQLLLNETTVESGNECAQLCYDLKCGFAYYKPSDKTCRFTSNTEDVVDGSSCDEASEHSVPEEEAVITCISCDIEATPAQNIPQKGEASPPRIDFSVDASPSPPTIILPASTLYPACIINFQLDEEADTLSFKHYEVKKVKSVNECARICFRGGCSTAVYSPQSLECRLGTDLKETCTNAPSTIRYLKQSDVKIQCFRCSSPKHFAKEIEAQQTETAPPVISHQEDQQGVSQHVDEAPPTTLPTVTEKTPTGTSTPGQQPIEQKLNTSDEQAPFGKNCIIKFQARPLSKRPAELNAPFELDLNVDSVELCATRCYQDGCSGARYDPSNGTCSLAYNDKHFCAKEPTVLHYKADEVTWIHCVNCYSDKDLSGSPKETGTKSPIAIVSVVLPVGTTTETVISSETATTGPEDSGTTQPSTKEGPEETTAKTVTSGTEATEAATSGTKTVTSGTGATQAASSEGPQATSSAPESTPSTEGTTQKVGATSTHKPGSSKDFLRGCLIKFQARPIEDRPSHLKAEFEISLTVDSVELCATRCYQDGCTGAKYDPEAKSCALSYNDKQFCSNAEVRLHYDAKNVTWIHCVNCYSIKDTDRMELAEQQEAAPEHVSVDGGEKLPAAVEGSTTEIPEDIEPKQVLKNRTRTGSTPHFQKKCAVKFQARPYSKRPAESKAPFEIEIPVDSIELCATRCYQDGCTGAKYDPKSKSCALSYADKFFCEEDGEVVLHYDAKEPTWIHCVNCYTVKPRPTGAGPVEQNVTEPVAESTASPSETTTESESSDTSGTAVPVLPGATTAESVASSEGVTTSEQESSTVQPPSTEAPRKPETELNVTALSDDELKNLLDKGCVVTFQIVELEERPPEFTASFDPPFETETAEICAYRCYQDGCTGAKYDPTTRECALSYNDRAQCSNAKLVQVARPQQPVFMHCFSCVPHLMLPNMTGPGPFSESIDGAPGTEEKPVTAPTAKTTETAESTTPPSEAESSTPLGTTGTAATTSPIAEAAVTEASGEEATTELSKSTTAHEEASGEEPLDKTTPAEVTSEVSNTPTESETATTPRISTVTVAVAFIPVEGATAAAPGSSEGTTEQPSSTISREEASGEEPSEKSTTPRIEASVDEVGTTESTAVVSTTSGNIATEETIAPKVHVKLEGSVTEPGLGETTTEKGMTTSFPEEASGEEPAVKSTTPGEQVGSGGSTTAPSESKPEATTTGAKTELTTPASTLGGEFTSATTSPMIEGFVTEASGEEATTEKSEPTTTHEETSGEEQLDKNAVPRAQANLDESASTQESAESTPIGSSTTASTSGTATSTQGITLVPIVFAPAEGSTTQASTEQTTTMGFSTITPKEGASGEEPLDKSALPTVQASLDETTTEPAVSTPESSATSTTGTASATTPSTTEESLATTPAVESFVTEASGEQPMTEKSETTSSQTEASGEEPIDKTAVGEVVSASELTTTAPAENTSEGSTASVTGSGPETTPQGITIVPVAFIPVKPTTEASSEQTTTGKESTTSSPEEASGEGPLDKNAVPVVQASVDETNTSVAVESTPETSRTTASGPSSSELTTATIKPAEAFVTEASGEETKAETSTVAIPPIIPVVSTTTSAAETSGEEPSSSTNAGLGEEISVPTEATTGHTTVSTTVGEEASGEEPLDKNAVPKAEASVDETPSSTAGSKEEGSTTVAPGGETTTTRRDVVTVAPIVFIPVPAATTVSSERTTVTEESSTTPSKEASGEEPLGKSVSEATTVSAEVTSENAISSTVESSGLEASGEQTTTEAAGISATNPPTTEQTLAPKVFLTETATEPAREQAATGKSTVTTPSPEEASGEEPLDKNVLPKVAASIDEVPTTAEHPGTVTATLATVTSPIPSHPEGEEAISSPAVESTASVSGEQTTKLPTTSSPEEASGEEPLDKSAISDVQAKADETSGTPMSTPETSTGKTELTSTGHSTEETLAPAVSVVVESTVTEPGAGLSTTAKTVTTSSPEEASGEEPLDKNAAPDVQASLDETTTVSEVTTPSSGTESTSAPSTAKVIVPVILLPDGSKAPTSSEPTTEEQTTTPPEEASGEQPLDKNALPQKEGQETTTAESTAGTTTTISGKGGDEIDIPTTSLPVQGSVTSREQSTTVRSESTTIVPLESSGEEPGKSAAVTEFTRVQETTTPSEESSGEEPVVSNTLPKVASSIDEGTTKVPSLDEPGKASTEPSTEAGTEHSGEEPTTGHPPSDQSRRTGEHETTTHAKATAETSTVSIPPIIPVVGTSVSPSTSNIEETRSSTVAIPPIIPVTGQRENELTTPAVEASGEERAESKTPSAEEKATESTTPSTTVTSGNKEEIFVPTGGAEDHTTLSSTGEGSGEETPVESNTVPKLEASHDEETSTESASTAHASTPSEPLVFITESPEGKTSTESTESKPHSSTPSEPLEFITESPEGKTSTESTESKPHSSTPSEPLEFITENPEGKTSTESTESKPHSSTPSEPLEFITESPEGKTSTESTESKPHSSTPSEPLEFITESPEGKTSTESKPHSSTPSEPLEFITESPEGKTSTESKPHSSTPSEPLEFITESPEGKTTSLPAEEGSGEEPLGTNKIPKVEASMDEDVHSTPASESTTGGPTTTLVFVLPGGAVTEKSGTTTPAIEASGEDPHHIPKIEPNIDEITSAAPSSTSTSHEANISSSTTVASEDDHSTAGAFIMGSDQSATTVAPLESSTTEQLAEETTPTSEVSTSPSTEGSGEGSVEGKTPRVDFSIDESKPIVRVIPGVIVSIERITEASPANTTHSQATLTTTSAHTTGDENEVTSSTLEPQTETSGEEPLGSTSLPKVEARVDGGTIEVPSTEASETSGETSTSSSATSSPEGPEVKASTVALPPVIPVIGLSGSTSTPSGVEEGASSTVEIAPLIPATPVTGKGETSTAAMPPIVPVGSTTTPAEETSGEEPTSSTNAGLGDEISVPTEGAERHTTSTATSSPEVASTTPEEGSGEGPLESNNVPKVEASLDDGTGSANAPDKSTHSTSPPLGHPHLLFGPSTTSASVSAHLNVHATELAESSTPLSGEEPSERQNVPQIKTSPEGSSTISPSTEAKEAGESTTAAPSSDHTTIKAAPTLLAVSEQSSAATSTHPGVSVTEPIGEETTPQAEESTTSSVEGSGEEEVTSAAPKLDSSTDETRSSMRIVPGLIVSIQRTTEVPEVTGVEPSSHPSSSTPSAPSEVSSEQTTVEKTYESTTMTPNEAKEQHALGGQPKLEASTPSADSSTSAVDEILVPSTPHSFVTEAAGEITTPTTLSSVEGSGEESEIGKSPTVEASVDDSKATVISATEPSEESTTAASETQSSQPSTTATTTETISGVHVVPLLVVSSTEKSDERHTTPEETVEATKSREEGNKSTSTRPTVSDQEEIFVPTKADGDHTTPSPTGEGSGEETPVGSNTVPKLEASHDEETSAESASKAHASTPSEPLEFITESPEGKTSTESKPHSSTPSEPLEFITDSPEGKTSTEPKLHSSTPSEPLVFITGIPEGETSTEASTESKPHSSTPSEPLEFITDSPEGKTSTEPKPHSSTPSEPLEFITESPEGKTSTESASTVHASTPSEPLVFVTDSPNLESHSTSRTSGTEGPAPSHPLDSSFVHDVTPSTPEDLINRTLLEPHKTSLPINVGFVPGSEPDTFTESEEEEEESENTELTTQPDYEDAVASKKPESTSVATSTTAKVSTTTEPPVQAVQDLIDALAAGGLNAVLGPPRQTQLVENVNNKLGDLKKYLHKPLEQKQDCASRRLRFVASELTDLSTRFSADAAVYSLQHCARMCYETGCTLAAFTRFPRPVCLMRYGNSTAACDSGAKRTSSWSFASVQQVVKLECIECEKNSEFITQKEQIDITNLKDGFSTDDLNTVVPAHEGLSSKCDGRLEFHTLPVGSLPRLNITNDVPARTPADCAKKCFETGGCSTAGFIASPAGNISHGVCLLTSDSNVCGNNADYVPQYAALNPFVISCIKCTPCTYNIRSVTPDRVLPEFNHAESVSSIGECARACYARRCTIAQYSSQQKSCMMTSEPMESQCAREVAVVTEGVLPVTLECVSCSS